VFYTPDGNKKFGGKVKTQDCSSRTSNTKCFEDPYYCRYTLNNPQCLALPSCTTENICVSVNPAITFEPKTGSKLGKTKVNVMFNTEFPAGTSMILTFGTTAISETTPLKNPSGDIIGLSFATPSSGSDANIKVKIGTTTITSDDKFRFYDCNGATCGSCLQYEDRPECVWVPSENKCSSSTITKSSFDNKNVCPAVASINSTKVASGVVVAFDLSPIFDTKFYRCGFSGGSTFYSTGKISGGKLNCAIPKDVAVGTYTVVISAFNANYNTYSTYKDGEPVKLNIISCETLENCGSCAPVAGCSWCLGSNSFSCVSDGMCSSSVSYIDTCPSIKNKLYIDGEKQSSGKALVNVSLANAQLSEENTKKLKCVEGDSEVKGTCTYYGEDNTICQCEFSVKDASSGSQSVDIGINYTDNKLIEGKFYTVNCNHMSYSECFSDESKACVWDIESNKCIALPTDHKSVTWVSEVPKVLSYEPSIDAGGQSVLVQFSSIVNQSSLSFSCVLLDIDDSSKVISNQNDKNNMIFYNETCAYCKFSDFTSNSKLEEGSTNRNVALEVRVQSRRRDNTILDLFEDLNSVANLTLSVHNCGSTNEKLNCSTCRTYQGCSWSKMYAKCTSETDETSSTTECPTITAIAPNSATFYKGDNVTLKGTYFIDGLSIVFTPQDKKNKAVSGNLTYVNPEIVNFTFADDVEADKYNISIRVLSNNRSFANTKDLTVTALVHPISLTLILCIAIPVGAVVIALIIIAIVLIVKRGGLRPYSFDVNKKPDFSKFAYATDIWNSGRGAAGFPDDDNARNEFRSLLQDPNVCAAICKATSSTEADKFTGAMVYVNATNGHCIDLLMMLVDQEVESVPNSTQLFRGNSLASKAFRAYSRMVGLDYLWMTLARFIHELNHLANAKEGKKDADQDTNANGETSVLSTEFEVDPTKLAAGADEESQSYALSQRARQLVLCIINSTQYLPPDLRAFAVKLSTRVTQRFPEAEHIAIGGTFFLRFICPAIIAPHSYGLLMTSDRKNPVVPSDRLQRQLILLGKVLQNLANGVLFGKKEPFMIGMNDFISSNLEQVNDWMEKISKGNGSFSEQPGSVPQKTVVDSYNFLASHVRNNMPKIRSALQQQNVSANVIQRLESAVGN